MKAIIYTRVSTDDQADRGYSLPYQLEVLTKYCQMRNISIVRHFQEDFSAKNFERPEFQKVLQFIKANRKEVDLLLFTRWDRFSRNTEESYKMIRVLRKLGVKVDSVEQSLDLEQPDSKIMLAIYLTVPEVENDKNSIRTTEGMRKAKREGYWVGCAPYGYKNCRTPEERPTLIPNEKAELVKEAFTLMAQGIYSADEIRKQLKKKGMTLQKQAFLNMFRNPVYTGKIFIKEWKKEDEEVVEGVHPALISEAVFNKVQEIFSGKSKTGFKSDKYNNELYLRGFLVCPVCGGNLTGSRSKGNGGGYYYYHCNGKCMYRRTRADNANKQFYYYITSFKPTREAVELYFQILKDVAKEMESEKLKKLKLLDKEIKIFEDKVIRTEDMFVDKEITKGEYEAFKKRYSVHISEMKVEKLEILSSESKFDRHLKFGLSLLSNLDVYFEKAPVEIKHKIISLFFPSKLIFENGSYRTIKRNQVLDLIYLLSSEMDKIKMKQAGLDAGLSSKAPQTGLEPVTL